LSPLYEVAWAIEKLYEGKVNKQSELDTIMDAYGIQIEALDTAQIVCSMQIKSEHLNSFHVAFGGVLFHVADLAAGRVFMADGSNGLTVSGTIHYVAPVPLGTVITCTAKIIKRGVRLSYIDVVITNATGVVFTTVSYIFSKVQYE